MKTPLRYLISTLAGAAAVILGLALFYWGMNLLFFLDGRYLMGRYPLVSGTTMGVVFFAAFFLCFRRFGPQR